MFKKLCILLIFSKLNVTKLLIDKYRMHNLYAIFAKLLNICKQIAGNLVNESGNVPRRGVVPKFSDLEVVALNMASEAVGIDSESLEGVSKCIPSFFYDKAPTFPSRGFVMS